MCDENGGGCIVGVTGGGHGRMYAFFVFASWSFFLLFLMNYVPLKARVGFLLFWQVNT